MNVNSRDKYNNGLISIIIPVYNVKAYLEECIQCVIGQTYSNLEIVLVDDGSNDGSGEICDLYKKKDDRIVVVHQRNAGLSAARNKGIDIATGEYLFLLDSDDIIYKNTIEIMYHHLLENNADLVVVPCKKVYDSEIPEFLLYQEEYELILKSGKDWLLQRYVTSDEKLSIALVTAWGILYRKEAFSNLHYPVGKLHEDEYITYKILYKCQRVLYISAQLYLYRQRENSIMAMNFSEKSVRDSLEALLEKRIYYVDNFEVELGKREVVNILNYICETESNILDKTKYNSLLDDIKIVFNELYQNEYERKYARKNLVIKFYMYNNLNKIFVLLMKLRRKM